MFGDVCLWDGQIGDDTTDQGRGREKGYLDREDVAEDPTDHESSREAERDVTADDADGGASRFVRADVRRDGVRRFKNECATDTPDHTRG